MCICSRTMHLMYYVLQDDVDVLFSILDPGRCCSPPPLDLASIPSLPPETPLDHMPSPAGLSPLQRKTLAQGLEERGTLLQRSSLVIAGLQSDLEGLQWEVEHQQEGSCPGSAGGGGNSALSLQGEYSDIHSRVTRTQAAGRSPATLSNAAPHRTSSTLDLRRLASSNAILWENLSAAEGVGSNPDRRPEASRMGGFVTPSSTLAPVLQTPPSPNPLSIDPQSPRRLDFSPRSPSPARPSAQSPLGPRVQDDDLRMGSPVVGSPRTGKPVLGSPSNGTHDLGVEGSHATPFYTAVRAASAQLEARRGRRLEAESSSTSLKDAQQQTNR
jgi:hypothetical protein